MSCAAVRDGTEDSWLELKQSQNEDRPSPGIGAIQMLQIQDEIDYIVGNLENVLEPH